MLKVAIIVGSTRPNRKAEVVANWIYDTLKGRKDAVFEIVDIKDFNLPLLDEALPASMGSYSQPHTKTWSVKIASFDSFIFVTPEYNHGTSAALKNAIDFLYVEWNNKSAGFVSYGYNNGIRAVEQLRIIMGALQIADVNAQVALSMHQDFSDFSIFKPSAHQIKSVHVMADQLLAWGEALLQLRISSRANNKLVTSQLPESKKKDMEKTG